MNSYLSNNVASAIFVFFSILIIMLIILIIVAWWKLFTKAGEKGWKSLIPIYNTYIIFKLVWKRSWFFITLIVSIVSIALCIIGSTMLEANSQDIVASLLLLSGALISVFTIVIEVIICFKMSFSYGHNIGYGFGLLFLPNIFALILAFGISKYQGANVNPNKIEKVEE